MADWEEEVMEDVDQEALEAMLEQDKKEMRSEIARKGFVSPDPVKKLAFPITPRENSPSRKQRRIDSVTPEKVWNSLPTCSSSSNTPSPLSSGSQFLPGFSPPGTSPTVPSPNPARSGISRELPLGEYITASDSQTGDYVYVPIEPLEEDFSEIPPPFHSTLFPNSTSSIFPPSSPSSSSRSSLISPVLLSTPIGDLIATVEAIRQRKMEQALEEGEKDRLCSVVPGFPREVIPRHKDQMDEEESTSQLWVNKYEPKSFRELLSDNQINLEVVQWLMEWNEFVFHKSLSPSAVENSKKKSLDSRPMERILLLTGGPGVGKTTLAHIAARHVGYYPTEVNASMERTETQLKEHFISSTGQQMTLSHSKNTKCRPTCLIVDEIDGVASNKDQRSAIDLLVKMATARLSVREESQGKDDGEDEADGKSKPSEKRRTASHQRSRQVPALARPVICICNNPWAPALRDLKKIAKTYAVPDIDNKRMAERLRFICQAERLRYDRSALSDLCELSQGDIRSCLNTLQFLKINNQIVTSKTIHESKVGIKDQVRELFSIWTYLFHQLDKQKYLRLLCKNESQAQRMSSLSTHRQTLSLGFSFVLGIIMEHHEQDRILEGAMENYLHIRFADADLFHIQHASDWFAWAHHFSHSSFRYQAYSLLRYVPYGIAQAYLHCSSPYRPPRFTYPRAQQTSQTTLIAQMDLLRVYCSGLSPSVQTFLNPRQLVHDTLTYLLCCLNPAIKLNLSNITMLSASDKRSLQELAKYYVYYNLGFLCQQQGHLLTWNADTEIDRLLTFGNQPPSFTPLPSKLREMLTQKIQYEKLSAFSRPTEADTNTADMTRMQAMSKAKITREKELRLENERKLAQKIQARPSVVKRDFFGRPIVASSAEPNSSDRTSSKSSLPLSYPIRFQYNEGFTNAIRRPTKIEDLL